MSSKPKVLMIITLDTKAVEANYIRGVLESQGVDVVHLDPSIRESSDSSAEIPPEAVARAAGKTIQEVRDLGESVLALGHIDLTARTTGIEFTEEVGSLMTFRGGKVITSQDFLSHAEALEAAGLSDG